MDLNLNFQYVRTHTQKRVQNQFEDKSLTI